MMSNADATSAPASSGGGFVSLLQHARRYVTAGIGSAATDFAVLVLLTRYAGWSAFEANLVSRPCGGLFSFVVNKLWTFGRREAQGTISQMRRFWIVWLGAYAASSLLVWVFSRCVGWGALPSKMAAESVVSPTVFFIMRHWTFRAPRVAEKAS